MKKNTPLYYISSFLGLGIIIYLYFLKWKNVSFHDDDLFVLKSYGEASGFWGKVNMATSIGIFRPFQGLSIYFLVETFSKNLDLYYLYNVLFQTINAFLFARVLDIFLRSPYLSLFISLILGLSRYCYYNIVQLYGGGALEGLALMFFLLFLHITLRTLTQENASIKEQRNGLLLALLYANFCMYTHERYAVLLPFIILLVLLFPSIKSIGWRNRVLIIGLGICSIALPLLIKKYYFSMQLFMGTGYTSISFSFSSILSFLISAILSVFQINTGPEYLSGIPFSSLSTTNKFFLYLFAASTLFFLLYYLYRTWKTFRVRHIAYLRIQQARLRKKFAANTHRSGIRFYVFIALTILFFMLLAPAVIQIRIELRWLEAPLATFILMVIIAISGYKFRSISIRNAALLIFTSLFIWLDYCYLDQGAKNLYFSTAARIGETFYNAIKNNVIHKNNTHLYIWENHRNPDREGEITWALAGGYFFKLYSNKQPQIIYIDSLYQKTDSTYSYALADFNKDSAQIVMLKISNDGQTFKYALTDITGEYMKDSLKTFKFE